MQGFGCVALLLVCALPVAFAEPGKFDPSGPTSAATPLSKFVEATTASLPRIAEALGICASGQLPKRAGLRVLARRESVGMSAKRSINQNLDRYYANLYAIEESRRAAHMQHANDTFAQRSGHEQANMTRINETFAIHTYLINMLPAHPEAISLLACLVEHDVIDLSKETDDNGAQLVFLASIKKHLRLLTLLLQKGAAFTHIDHADAGFGTIHAAISNNLVVMEYVQQILGRDNSLGNVSFADFSRRTITMATTMRKYMSVEDGRLLERSLIRLLRLSPAALRNDDNRYEAAVAESVHARDMCLRSAQCPPIRAADARIIANSLSTLLVRMIGERVLQVANELFESYEVGQPSSCKSLQRQLAQLNHVLTGTDRYFRTPFHIVAATGNNLSVKALLAFHAKLHSLLQFADQCNSPSWTPAGRRITVSIDGTATPTSSDAAVKAVQSVLRQQDSGRLTAAAVAAVNGYQDSSTLFLQLLGEAPAAPPTPAPTEDEELPSDAAEYVASGGWEDPAELSAAANNALLLVQQRALERKPCDIDVVSHNITAEEFFYKYVAPGRPVVLKQRAAAWPSRELWTRETLLTQFNTLQFDTGNIPYAKAFATRSASTSTLDAYLAATPDDAYVFGLPAESAEGAYPASALLAQLPLIPDFLQYSITLNKGLGLKFLPDIPLLENETERDDDDDALKEILLRYDAAAAESNSTSTLSLPWFAWSESPLVRTLPALKPQFYLGYPGTGAPMHFHKDAWNMLAHGQKRWYLLPPADAQYSTQPIASWVQGGLAAAPASLQECTQDAGDIMFVPRGWSHAVLNLHTSVGIAVEFTTMLTLF
jgi:hypothetical protein